MSLAGSLIILTLILLFYPHRVQLSQAPGWGQGAWLTLILLFYVSTWNSVTCMAWKRCANCAASLRNSRRNNFV